MASSHINIYIIKPSNGHNFGTTGRIFAGFSVFTKPTFTCVKSTGCIPKALGSTIRPKRRKNTGAQIPVAVLLSSLLVS